MPRFYLKSILRCGYQRRRKKSKILPTFWSHLRSISVLHSYNSRDHTKKREKTLSVAWKKIEANTDASRLKKFPKLSEWGCGPNTVEGVGGWWLKQIFLMCNREGVLYLKSDLCISRNKTVRPCSEFLHSCICEGFIYSQDQSAFLAAAK
jgi:hypothetical protein